MSAALLERRMPQTALHLGADPATKPSPISSRPSSAAATSRSRPARVAKFPVNCVNYFTLGCRKIWEPYFAKLNAATQRRCKCA
jgi:hypothetical protein